MRSQLGRNGEDGTVNIGTKTILFGNHQFILHPFLVWLSWVRLYHKLPSFWESVAILIHDWGYWGKPNMDGSEGESHPLWAAKLLLGLRGERGNNLFKLCAFHSRFLARRYGQSASKLCLADKACILLTPSWLWLLLGGWSGEVVEYMAASKYEINKDTNHTEYTYVSAYKDQVQKWVDGSEILF